MKDKYTLPGLRARLRHLALAALLACGATTAHAQFYSAANVLNQAGTYTDLGTSGTVIATPDFDDSNSAVQTLPFPFTYSGTVFNQFVLNTNGFLKLGSVAPAAPFFSSYAQEASTGGPLNSATETNLVLPFNTDLEAGTGTPEYRMATTGTAPNRVLTIQWKNVSDKTRAASSTAAGNIDKQFTNFSFQVKLYESSNSIDFVYGTATPSGNQTNANFIVVGLKGTSTAAAQVITAIKASNSAWSGTVFQAGPYTSATNAFNIRATPSIAGGTPLPDPGRTFSFSVQVANDAAASAIQGYGSIAVPVGNSFSLRGVVRNSGSTALSNTPVTLTISGANTYTQTQTVPSLALNATGLATFTGISLPNVGTNTVTISVASDGNNANNSVSQTMETSASTFSFIAPGVPQSNSYGFSPAASGFTSAFCAKFTVNAARAVTAVRAIIGNDPDLAPNAGNGQRTTTVFGVVINATTGDVLGRSPDYVLTSADIGQLHTFTLVAPTTVPAGDFLVGLAQVVPAGTATDAVFPMAFQTEVPARPGLFFSAGVSATGPPNDNTGDNARYMLEAVTAAPSNNDLAVAEIQGYGSIAVPVGNPVALRAVVRNSGAAALNNVTVTLTITGANTVTQTQTLTSVGVGGTALINFTGITLNNVGANTVTVSVPNDDNNANNLVAQQMATSATRFSFITPGVPAVSSFGFTPNTAARTLAFCGKFTVNAARDVTAVRAVIGNDTDLLPNAANGQRTTTVYGVVVNATTGALIARSPDYVLTAADLGQLHTFNLSANVPAGDFLVGLAQVLPVGTAADAVFPMAYQAETPARTGTFFIANITTPGAPQDGAVNDARYMLEAELSAPATCPVPTALAITGSTATSVSFSFTAAAGATGYQIVYGPQGFTPGTTSSTSATFTGTTYTLTGLAAGNTYDFYVRTICSATDQSNLAGPVRATTACTAPTISTFPYTQSFDVVATGQTLPCGITVADANNDGYTWQARGTVPAALSSTSVARSAPNAMVYVYNDADITVGANDWFYTPALALATGQSYRLSFYYRVATGGYTERLEVKYGTAATPAGQTTTIFTNNAITNTAYTVANNASTPAVLDITPTTGTYYIGFHAISGASQGFLAVDDVVISASPLATSEALKRAISVFPNPSISGIFNLEIHGANVKKALGVEVTNMLGQRVYTGTAKDNFRSEVNLSSLAPGIYNIKVRNGEEYTMQQISIVK
ncbi:T9SS type A sorting domain-containing protein [Hymenobacter sp. BT770]|uniref:T9SS type A sorting domain-containing protein n=1 Tax=Hymenobacter sp. BT770 TaxID=2886942 RepID=UPI001D117420|nr:T9SS type A sorting domain-containing protein [Hymenobacter sp. BT770]MCC3151495.1 T9SS type A sorting domain-containing protein [Hymenobacter sp. BT770]MDO3413929.1 T9SS type A sorting domain-containing protein [Hymenobacter sp. BT770]